MTTTKALKELLKINLMELKDNTCLNISEIDFKGDEADKVIEFIKELIKN